MKNLFRLFILAAMVAAVSCSKENEENEEQPIANSVLIDFEGPKWDAISATTLGKSYSAEIVDEQYNFPYNPIVPLWSLNVFVTVRAYSFTAAGFTVSSYNTADCNTYGSYEYDQYLYNSASQDPTKGGGHNGSNNFIVAFGTDPSILPNEKAGQPGLYFSDGVERTIKSCWVASTSYFVNVAKNGNSFAEPLRDGDVVKLYAKGYDKSGRLTGVVEKVFARKGALTEQWTEWDLSALGKVETVHFDVSGGPETPYGMTMPKYFAIDDITVEW